MVAQALDQSRSTVSGILKSLPDLANRTSDDFIIHQANLKEDSDLQKDRRPDNVAAQTPTTSAVTTPPPMATSNTDNPSTKIAATSNTDTESPKMTPNNVPQTNQPDNAQAIQNSYVDLSKITIPSTSSTTEPPQPIYVSETTDNIRPDPVATKNETDDDSASASNETDGSETSFDFLPQPRLRIVHVIAIPLNRNSTAGNLISKIVEKVDQLKANATIALGQQETDSKENVTSVLDENATVNVVEKKQQEERTNSGNESRNLLLLLFFCIFILAGLHLLSLGHTKRNGAANTMCPTIVIGKPVDEKLVVAESGNRP